MDINKAVERCNQLIKVEHANWIGISNQEAIDTVLNELETYKKAISKMAISLGIADTDYKNMELEDIINHFLGR